MSEQPEDQDKPNLRKRVFDKLKKLKDWVAILSSPEKIVGLCIAISAAFTWLFHDLLGRVPIWSIYAGVAMGAVATIIIAVLVRRRWPAKWWPWIGILVPSTGFAILICVNVPKPVSWTRIDVLKDALVPPLDLLKNELIGKGRYPGGNPFRKKVESWRKDEGIVQWAAHKTSVFTPNRAPHRIALRDSKLPATLGAYLFVKGEDGWRQNRTVGFGTSTVRNLSLDDPKLEGREFCIVLFIFPFTEGAANVLEKSADDVVETSVD